MVRPVTPLCQRQCQCHDTVFGSPSVSKQTNCETSGIAVLGLCPPYFLAFTVLPELEAAQLPGCNIQHLRRQQEVPKSRDKYLGRPGLWHTQLPNDCTTWHTPSFVSALPDRGRPTVSPIGLDSIAALSASVRVSISTTKQ